MKAKRCANLKPVVGIRRIDSDVNRTHAWAVFLQRRGRIFHKYFSDGRYGGRQAAYHAAVAYRATLAQRHLPITRREFVQIRKRSNRSGHVGVVKYRYVDQTTQGRRVRLYWIAIWTPERGGRPRQKKFSILKYGNKRAFELAKETRRKAVVALQGYWKVHAFSAA
jgi:hypothetical protein